MSKRNRREHGRIISVETLTRGDALAADVAAGATSITVNDAGDFDEDGGWLYIGTQTVEYTACDDDTGIITLTDPLEAAAEQGDPVAVWSPLYEEVVDYQEALVELDGEYDNPDPVVAEVAEGVEDLPEGDRGKAGESCTLKRVADDEWEVVGVGGRARKSRGVKFHQHTHVVADVGTQSFRLPHVPIENSEHLYWNGLYQSGSEWARTDRNVAVPDPDGRLRVNDELVVEYAYRVGLAEAGAILVDWQATGWSYLFSTASVDVDRSAVGYDDSGWSTGPAAFGNAAGHPSNYPAGQKSGWPDKSTTWTVTPAGSADDHIVWLRRHLTVTADATLVVRARIDNAVTIYWNGTLIGSGANHDFTPVEVEVPAGLAIDGDNVLAVRAEDYGLDNYLDVQVEQIGGAA